MPQSDVPGEKTSPTQPYPVKPPPLARTTFSTDDIVTADDRTAEHARARRELYERSGGFINEGIFTPWPFCAEPGATPRAWFSSPAPSRPRLGGTASDPNTGYVYAFTQDVASIGWMQEAPSRNYRDPRLGEPPGVPYIRGHALGPGPYARSTRAPASTRKVGRSAFGRVKSRRGANSTQSTRTRARSCGKRPSASRARCGTLAAQQRGGSRAIHRP